MTKVHNEIDDTLRELQQWIEKKHGREKRVAKILGVSPQLVSDWFARRALPRLVAWLCIKQFLAMGETGRQSAIQE